MDHSQAIANKVKALFNIEKPDDNSIFVEVHRNASAKVNDILQDDYARYIALFTDLTDLEYDAILALEYYLQTDEQKILMKSENAEAYLYMYYLMDKLRFISEDDIRLREQSFGTGSIKPEDINDMIDFRHEYYNKAKAILLSIDFDNYTVVGVTDMWINTTKTIAELELEALEALESTEGI